MKSVPPEFLICFETTEMQKCKGGFLEIEMQVAGIPKHLHPAALIKP